MGRYEGRHESDLLWWQPRYEELCASLGHITGEDVLERLREEKKFYPIEDEI